MQLKDARSLPPQAQQAIRKRAVKAVIENKHSQGEVAQELGVTRTAVNQWMQRYRRGGETALKACQQGRREHPTLARSNLRFGERSSIAGNDNYSSHSGLQPRTTTRAHLLSGLDKPYLSSLNNSGESLFPKRRLVD
jgi:predicted transcriptional regulator